MRQKCKVMFKIQYTLITVTRNLFSSSSCIAPLIDPTAQHNYDTIIQLILEKSKIKFIYFLSVVLLSGPSK